MCLYDDARAPVILETLGALGVIKDIAQMVVAYGSCDRAREETWPFGMSFGSECGCIPEKRKRRYVLQDSVPTTWVFDESLCAVSHNDAWIWVQTSPIRLWHDTLAFRTGFSYTPETWTYHVPPATLAAIERMLRDDGVFVAIGQY